MTKRQDDAARAELERAGRSDLAALIGTDGDSWHDTDCICGGRHPPGFYGERHGYPGIEARPHLHQPLHAPLHGLSEPLAHLPPVDASAGGVATELLGSLCFHATMAVIALGLWKFLELL